MPCVYRDERTDLRETRQELNRLTALLCEVCQRFDEHDLSAELRSWWAEHQEQDRRRTKALEKAIQRAERKAFLDATRERLLTQLTVDELEALGIPSREIL